MPASVRPDDLVTLLRSGESARPRLIWHAPDERIELSGRVLATWASKVADLLQDDLDAGPGSRVALDGTPHWRLLAWALGAWTVGATVVGDAESSGPVDVLVADGDRVARGDLVVEADTVVGLTRAALARTSPVALPPGVLDDAATLLSHADQVEPHDRAEDDDLALAGREERTYAGLLRPAGADRIHVSGTRPLDDVLVTAASAWAAGGSIVLTDPAWEAEHGGDPTDAGFAAVLESEGVSAPRD